jgi:hypothetical protein
MLTKADTRKAHEGDVVELLQDYPKYNLKKGQRGIVISEFDEPAEAYDLEITDEQGNFLCFGYSIKPEHIVNLSRGALERGFKYLGEGNIISAKEEFEYAIELRPVEELAKGYNLRVVLLRANYPSEIEVQFEQEVNDARLERRKDTMLFWTGIILVATLSGICVWTVISEKFSADEKKWAISVLTLIVGAISGYMIGRTSAK